MCALFAESPVRGGACYSAALTNIVVKKNAIIGKVHVAGSVNPSTNALYINLKYFKYYSNSK